MNFDDYLSNPCVGIRKALKFQYVTRGILGCIRVREKDDNLIANVEIGYMPVPPRDEAAL